MVYVINDEHLTRRKLVTIDGSKVTSETDIPLSLNINLPRVKAAGADVRLAKLDGTPIAREIECKDVPNTDDIMIWYQWNTTVSQNDQFYVYWGNPNLTEPAEDATYGREAVWASEYKGVWNMAQDPSGSAPQMIDSTSNDKDGTSGGSMTSDDLINGSYNKEIDFEGTDDYIDIGLPYGVTSSGTKVFSITMTPDTADTEYIITNYDAGSNGFSFIYNSDRTLGISWTNIINVIQTSATLTLSQPARIVVVYNTGATGGKIYINGSLSVEGDLGSESTATNKIRMCGRWVTANSGSAVLFDGKISRVNFGNVVLSANKIATIDNSIKNPTASGTTPFYLSFSSVQHQRRVPQFIG